ncbi:MAG: Gfo/Idh/MocA family protein [Elusimicrobiota bacterium]
MINVGIIGLGKMGQIRKAAVESTGRGQILAASDPVIKLNDKNIKDYPNPEQVISDSSIDTIFICTPNYMNKDLTIKGLEAGKNIFCEKPPAFSAKDIEEIIEVEKKSGKKLMYGFNHRHHDSVILAKQKIDSGQYGKILWMRGRYGKSVDENFFKNWRSKKELAGGGILIDQGIHMLDLFLMMAGDFEEVHAFVSNLYWKLDVEDNVFAILKNKNGVAASLHSTMTQWRHLFSLEVFLEKGYFVINGLLTSSGTYGQETMTIATNRSVAPAAIWSDEEHLKFEINNSWNYEIGHFFDAIDRNTAVKIGHSDDALKVMRLVDKIYLQNNKGVN